MTRILALALLAGVSLGACRAETHRGAVSLAEVQAPVVWGAADNAVRVRQLWFSRQPDAPGLQAAKDAGVTLVVDLRAPGERDWDEGAAAAQLGLAYRNIVVPEKGPFPEAAFASLEQLLEQHEDEQVLVHCSSGNRAAAWLTTHLVKRHGMSFADALEIGRRAGITKPEIVERTAAFLNEPAPPAEPAGTPEVASP